MNVTPDVIKLMAKSLIMAGTSSAAISGNGPSIQLDDRLSLSAKHVKLAAQEDFDLTANKTIRLITSKSSFRLDENARLKGTKILLNCDGDSLADDAPAAPPKAKDPADKTFLRVIAKDAGGKPYARRKYTLAVDGAKVADGESGDDGLIEHEVAPAAQKAEIKLLLDGGRSLVMPLTVGQFARSIGEGRQGRLRTLATTTAPSTTRPTRERRRHPVLPERQRVRPDGTLDKATKAKLTGLSGS